MGSGINQQYDLSKLGVRFIGTNDESTQISYDKLPSVNCKMNLIRAITYISHLRQGVSPIIGMRLEKKVELVSKKLSDELIPLAEFEVQKFLIGSQK